MERFLNQDLQLFENLERTVIWDERMKSRKTASFGVAYNYSQIEYPVQVFPPSMVQIIDALTPELGFEANNCLVNFHPDGQSKMGFHSDQTDILAPDTGVAIVSLGATRPLRFRSIADKTLTVDYELSSGSLLYMSQEVQSKWQHALPKSLNNGGRMSLTFRKITS